MHIHCTNPIWTVSRLTPRAITLKSSHPLANQWHHLRITLLGNVALDASKPILLRRNLNGLASRLLPGRRIGEAELVFFHGERLHSMQIEFPGEFTQGSHVIKVHVSERKAPFAIAKMLTAVYRSDVAAGEDPTRILRKSAKRLFLHGRQRFIKKLVRDYHPHEAAHYQAGDAYAAWISATENAVFPDQTPRDAAVAALDARPLISILLAPANGTPTKHLLSAIESVRRQSYPHWELCIADDSSIDPELRRIVDERAAHDMRIRVSRVTEADSTTVGSDRALALARGEWVSRLEPADQLAEHALYCLASNLSRHPDAQVIYSDHDSIDEQGNRLAPCFKPDWNPDLFLSQDYVAQLCAFRSALIRSAGGRPVSTGRGGDYARLLTCLRQVSAQQIHHIPYVLYHRRVGTSSAASGPLDALRTHFAAHGDPRIAVEPGLAPETWRVRYPVPHPAPLVSLIIPTRDRLELLEPCVRSILDKTLYPHFEILILDNESIEPATLDFFNRIQAEDPRVRVLAYHHVFNYSAINNYGVAHARGTLVGLINNDIEAIGADWLTEMVSHACRPEIGCVGAKLYYDNDTIQHAGVILGLWGVAGHAHKHYSRDAEGYQKRALCIQNYSAVTAACLVVRKEIYVAVGGLNDTHLTVAFNDVDFCLKVRNAGYRNLWTPFAELYHHESVSRGAEDTPEKKARERSEIEYMRATWADALARDPCYSPNLTHRGEDFSVNTDFVKG